MAGAGKSTFVSRLNSYLHTRKSPSPPYILNLDPAVTYLPYESNIDIRDTVNYREVMKQWVRQDGLLESEWRGFKGITWVLMEGSWHLWTYLRRSSIKYWTSLRSERIRLSKRLALISCSLFLIFVPSSYVILDTPGQIEIFTWSASGAIITDAIASSFPAVVAYIIDTPRTTAPATFMSNMLYACSILYKTRLPFILVFNKTDVQKHEFALEWMNDFEEFQAALASHSATRDSDGEPTYMSSLMNSMSLVLDEFYKNLKVSHFSTHTSHCISHANLHWRLLAFRVWRELALRTS